MASHGIQEQIDKGTYIPPPILAKAKAAIASVHQTFQKALAQGVKIGMGTDAAVYAHGRNTEEFFQMVDLGMKAIDALRAGTSADADLLGLADKIGTLGGGQTGGCGGGAGRSGGEYPANRTRLFCDERRRHLRE